MPKSMMGNRSVGHGDSIARRAGLAAIALWVGLGAVPAWAEDDPALPLRSAPISGDLSGLSDAELERRIGLLARDFEEGEAYASGWQWGFTGAWSAGIVIGTVQAAALETGDGRIPGIVTATKGVIGTTRLLLDPVPGRLGTEPLRAVPGDSRNALETRLRAGEEQLLRIEKASHDRDKWYTHTANVALNALGGGVIIAFGDGSDAYVNVGLGIAFGELLIFTKPRRGIEDLETYRNDISGAPRRPADPEASLSLVPQANGLGIAIRF